MTRLYRPALGLAVLGALTLVGGCDAGTPDDFDGLVDEARIAREGGDFSRAIELYEDALEQEPDSAPVRTELAATYLEDAELDLLDLDRFAQFLATGENGAAQPRGAGGACDVAGDPNWEPFDLTDVSTYQDIISHEAAIRLAIDVLAGGGPVPGGSPVVPDALRFADLCTGIVDGELNYDRAAALAEMRALGLSDPQIASALAVNAVSLLLDAYYFVAAAPEIAELDPQFYRHAETNEIRVCVTDVEFDADDLRERSEPAVKDIGESLASLDLRAFLLGGDETQELVDVVLDAYEAVRDDLGPVCTL
jgi:hypothetical protein